MYRLPGPPKTTDAAGYGLVPANYLCAVKNGYLPGKHQTTDEAIDGIDELLALKQGVAEDLAALVISNLGLIEETYQSNVEAIQWDIISVDNMIRDLPPDKNYFFCKERLDLEKEKLSLKKELRQEKWSRNQHAANLLRELREHASTIIKERAKKRVLESVDEEGDGEG